MIQYKIIKVSRGCQATLNGAPIELDRVYSITDFEAIVIKGGQITFTKNQGPQEQKGDTPVVDEPEVLIENTTVSLEGVQPEQLQDTEEVPVVEPAKHIPKPATPKKAPAKTSAKPTQK